MPRHRARCHVLPGVFGSAAAVAPVADEASEIRTVGHSVIVEIGRTGARATCAPVVQKNAEISTIDGAGAIEIPRTSGLRFSHDVDLTVVVAQGQFVVTDHAEHLAFGGVCESAVQT